MIRLFDWLHQEAIDLQYSLEAAGFEAPTVVIHDDGYLPNGMTSPYSYFCHMEKGRGKPLYFNQVPVPEFWQITGTNNTGEIWNFSEKRGTIYYHEPKHLRLVKNVDWLNLAGKVYLTDHYNQYGWLYAKTYFNDQEQVLSKVYYNQKGEEVVLENHVTGSILLSWQKKSYYFENRSDFIRFYFEEAGLDTSAIWYNSLSTPFIISYYLGDKGEDILFWQEKIGDHIPGNMSLILEGHAKRTKRIIVQDQQTYEQIRSLLPKEQQSKVSYLGYIYPERRANQNQKKILILTNSDQLHGLDTLLEMLADYQFHIAALTEMSNKLTAYGDKEQVTLYPNTTPQQVAHLFEQCDIYLDINEGDEILSALRQAFESNLVIAGFEGLLHAPDFLLPEAIFSKEAPEALAAWLQAQKQLSETAKRQLAQSGQEQKERYQTVLGTGET